MKFSIHTTIILIGIFCFQLSFGQSVDKKWGIGLGYSARDFTGIPTGQTDSIAFSPAFRIYLGRYLNPSLDLNFETGIVPFNVQLNDSKPRDLTDWDLILRYKFNNGYLLKETSIFSPYLAAGISGSAQDFNNFDPQASFPFGGGFRIQPTKTVSIDLNAMYKKTLTKYHDYFTLSGSIIINLGKSAPPEPEEDPDTDGDGVIDQLDNCPTEPGPIALRGCPDMDDDGIPDINDKCPETFGVEEYDGCPDVDRDKDGVNNEDDECPDVPGLANFNGCPDQDGDNIPDHDDDCPTEAGPAMFNGCPDTDGDGIPDNRDACPDEAGLEELRGCPEIEEDVVEKLEFATQFVQFQHARDVLLPVSYPVLDSLVKVLVDHPSYNLRVSGHTDAEGKPDYNMDLSLRRAKACIDYVISRGISQNRLVYIGYGESRPIADNFNETGKARNRRVEFEIFIK